MSLQPGDLIARRLNRAVVTRDSIEIEMTATPIPIAAVGPADTHYAERVRQHQKDGIIPRGEGSFVPLIGAVQGRLRYLED